jgi:hypothetical protein
MSALLYRLSTVATLYQIILIMSSKKLIFIFYLFALLKILQTVTAKAFALSKYLFEKPSFYRKLSKEHLPNRSFLQDK